MTRKPNELVGRVFGGLTVIKDTGERKYRKAIWECLCVCGKTKLIRTDSLMSGASISCGCRGENRKSIIAAKAKVANGLTPSLPALKVIQPTVYPAQSSIFTYTTPINYNGYIITPTILVAPVQTTVPVSTNKDYYNDIINKVHAIDNSLIFKFDISKNNTDILLCETCKVAIHFIDLATKNQEYLMINNNLTQVESKKFISGVMTEYITKGYKVITVFENEWLEKEYKLFNFLKSVLGCNKTTVYARKCYVKQIDKTIGRPFLKEEHIQGCANLSTIYFGLFETATNELLSVLTFGHHHREQSEFSNAQTSILDRFAVKSGYNIPGGASKLLKFAITELKKLNKTQIVSWSDKRISVGNLYKVLGFTLHQDLNPDYSYWNSLLPGKIVEGKQKNKKCNLKVNGIPVLQTKLTEYEATKLLNKWRIWDCGKQVWKMSI